VSTEEIRHSTRSDTGMGVGVDQDRPGREAHVRAFLAGIVEGGAMLSRASNPPKGFGPKPLYAAVRLRGREVRSTSAGRGSRRLVTGPPGYLTSPGACPNRKRQQSNPKKARKGKPVRTS
jgi:hypothetical protein